MRINLGIEAKAGIRPCKGCSKMPAARVVVTDNPNNTATFGIACNNCYIGTNGYVWSDVVRAWNQSYGTPKKAKPPSNEQVMDQRTVELGIREAQLKLQCDSMDERIKQLEAEANFLNSKINEWRSLYLNLLDAVEQIVAKENRKSWNKGMKE